MFFIQHQDDHQTHLDWFPSNCNDHRAINVIMEFNAQLSQRPQTFYLGSFQLLQLLPTVQKTCIRGEFKTRSETTRSSSCYKPANCPKYDLLSGINPQPRVQWVQKINTQKFTYFEASTSRKCILKITPHFHRFSNGCQNYVPLHHFIEHC